MDTTLTLDNFHFELPEHLIAQAPPKRRTDAKLFIRKTSGEVIHSAVRNLVDAFSGPCLFIVNDTKVIPARIFGETPTGAHIEFLLLKYDAVKNIWETMAKPKRRLRDNLHIQFPEGLCARIVSTTGQSPQSCFIQFECTIDALHIWLEKHGQMPVPPYIRRNQSDVPEGLHDVDRERYQTVFAANSGSVAAPTASLHFDDELIKEMKCKNFDFASVTLHVGAGTFLPVSSNNLQEHKMHSELCIVPSETLVKIEKAKAHKIPIVAVGTTTLRTLESFDKLCKNESDRTRFTDQWFETNLFIYPKTDEDIYMPWCIDALMTNFHQPGSTLFLLISALIGRKAALQAYDEAKERNYSFLSYGDSSLLWIG